MLSNRSAWGIEQGGLAWGERTADQPMSGSDEGRIAGGTRVHIRPRAYVYADKTVVRDQSRNDSHRSAVTEARACNPVIRPSNEASHPCIRMGSYLSKIKTVAE